MEGPYSVPPVARAALAATYVSSGNLTLSDYISRSQARITVSLPSTAFPLPTVAFCLPFGMLTTLLVCLSTPVIARQQGDEVCALAGAL